MNASAQFTADVVALLDGLSPTERSALSRLVTRLLVADAAQQGIDLFQTPRPTETNASVYAAFLHAPEWTRTTTDREVHKALNLVQKV